MIDRIPIHDAHRIDQLRSERRIEPGLLRRLRIAFFKKGASADEALAHLPDGARRAFAERVDFHLLRLDHRADSQQDGASKLIFKTDAGYLIESVILRPGTGRTALCVSSQIGCAAACDFCATGKMGMARNLPAAAILDQLVQANQRLAAEDRRVRNLVFMGMGEPLHNEANLHEVLAALAHPQLFHHPMNRVLVSTVGIPDAMVRLARRFPEVNLALSLHAVRQQAREQIVPLARRYPIDQLRATIEQLNRLQGKPVMLEHLMLAGLNDSLEEAQELAAWCEGLLVHVNLIPYNPIEGAPHLVGTPPEGRKRFAQVLKDAGVTTTTRYSMGQDIEAACGQLVQRGNREVARQASAAKADQCRI
ncbi:Ribosomal RNA large subunit methyltransferase Cfr [Posidoniimonas polymericola]|uniref:Ribosomal RNA large subunit methyltransferase Cfr n=1 Tax=Posidoniimonas polymericola TaxID=2528002 RepID=A0A5C5ZF51_9BACT|nr:23S rRNA (adenine(2503)-C(2))-methyltransferase RlmN [Posidoniimonas polymericola]TWT85816.1 Ribosomal RNA large subunit methyltransferase Cfr [Posidoniimonas polymericola]